MVLEFELTPLLHQWETTTQYQYVKNRKILSVQGKLRLYAVFLQ